jgi:hypothetical protein
MRLQGFPSPASIRKVWLVGKRCFMRLSSPCLAAVRLTLALAVILLFSAPVLAQHSSTSSSASSGGGSSSSGGGGSSSGGGGSHSSSSGGSSSSGSSGGSHSSGGSSSHSSSSPSSSSHSSGGSVSHGSSGHSSSSAPGSSHSGVREPRSNAVHSVREPSTGMRARTEPAEKRNFFSFLRHPFRRPAPKPAPQTLLVTDLRRPICWRGHCPVCPAGQARVGGVCGGTVLVNNTRNFCSLGEAWNGNACLLQTNYAYDCSALRMSLQQQEQRMRAAEAAQQSACSAGPSQDCSDLTSTSQGEASRYRTLQDRYRMCQQRSFTVNLFGRRAGPRYSQGLLFDPLEFDFDLDFR